MANTLTGSRLVLALVLFFTEPLSFGFYAIYTLCVATDMLDGPVARKTHTASKKGAQLDSIADLIFVTIVVIIFLPMVGTLFPAWLVWPIIGIALVRIAVYVIGFIKFHQFLSLHTFGNKATGVILFSVPYMMLLMDINLLSIIALSIALVSALEELLIMIKLTTVNPDIKSICDLYRRNIET
ncbi:CDP-alcohol phosphatidyltransferase family protein [Salipaludibacillus aurantiacus]|nr:CDP-alcohol phosphatidyltransferase family protein [Salipaludibacillus aurantiacus]